MVDSTHHHSCEKSARVADLSSIDAASEVPSSNYKPQVDLRRFQQLLEEEESCGRRQSPSLSTNFRPAGSNGVLVDNHQAKSLSMASEDLSGPQGLKGVVGNRHVVGVSSQSVPGCMVVPEKHPGTAWCSDSVDSLHEVRNADLAGEASSTVGPNELSAVPPDHSVSVDRSVTSVSSHLQPPGPIPKSHPLEMEKCFSENKRGPLKSLRKVEVEEDEEGGTVISTSTSKIHADLSRLEQVRQIVVEIGKTCPLFSFLLLY